VASRIVLLLIMIGAARIASTYLVLNHTMDEPSFISCGLEWLTQRTYTYMPEQPPLSHITAGAGAWLAGAHNVSKAGFEAYKAPNILYESPSYYRTLAFARAGELPFFVLAAILVWIWTRRLHGNLAGLAAVLLFTTLPPILAHAGLATTDMALCATLLAAVYAFIRWLEEPRPAQTVLFGIAIAAGVLSKFTFLLFFPVSAAVILAIRGKWDWTVRRRLSLLAAAAICAGLVWADYWFSFAPLAQGIHDAQEHIQYGHTSYLFGEARDHGWWYFFPVVLLYKTPLAFLVLAALACVWLRKSPREHWIPLACAIAILISVLPSSIDIGIRHILPVYALLAIPAGLAAARLIESPTRAARILGGFLVLWQLVASARAHPDYIASFNELALGRPELVRVDSDLDWGQNFDRLNRYLRKHGITEKVGLAMFGSVNPFHHGFRNWYRASPWTPSTGWIAVSATQKYMCGDQPPAGVTTRPWAWLDRYQPIDRISGGAVLLYHIDH
jgi:4-amino-4-deoxy-L-arabinose transferase-like glycosyltransferase